MPFRPTKRVNFPKRGISKWSIPRKFLMVRLGMWRSLVIMLVILSGLQGAEEGFQAGGGLGALGGGEGEGGGFYGFFAGEGAEG